MKLDKQSFYYLQPHDINKRGTERTMPEVVLGPNSQKTYNKLK